MEGGGIKQPQVFRQKNLSLNSVQGCTLFNSAMDGGGFHTEPSFLFSCPRLLGRIPLKLVDENVLRMYVFIRRLLYNIPS